MTHPFRARFLAPFRNARQALKAAVDKPCPYWTEYLREGRK